MYLKFKGDVGVIIVDKNILYLFIKFPRVVYEVFIELIKITKCY